MNHEHLTDERIQEILDARTLGTDPILPWHLKTCPYCQERLQEFRLLYEGLAADPGFALSPDFATTVLERIPPSRPALFRHPALAIAAGCILGVLAALGLSVFVNLKPLTDGMLRALDNLGLAFRPLATPLRDLFAWLGGSAKPFLYGGLGLAAAALVESLLPRFIPHLRH